MTDEVHCIEFNLLRTGRKMADVPLATESTKHHIHEIYFQ